MCVNLLFVAEEPEAWFEGSMFAASDAAQYVEIPILESRGRLAACEDRTSVDQPKE